MKRRILLADDSVTIQKVIELTFMDEDYEVRAVSNGDEAVALLSEMAPDFVIADVHMPGANGYEVCRRAKQLRPGTPVLLLVGTFEPFDEGQARSVGADSFLKKPFDSQELLQRVEELIAARAPVPSPPTIPMPIVPSQPFSQSVAPEPFAPPPVFTPPPAFDREPEPFAPAVPEPSPAAEAAQPLDWASAPEWAAAHPGLDVATAEPPAPAGMSFMGTAAVPGEFAAEPMWGNFDLESAPAPDTSATEAAEPYDREPSFTLEPEPGYQVEAEPVFSLEEDEPSFAVREDVFGAPSDLSLDETPQDRYIPDTLEEPAAPSGASAGFAWNEEPEPIRFEEAPAAAVSEDRSWSEPLQAEAPEPQQAWSTPEPAYPPAAGQPAYEPSPAPAAAASNGNGHLSDADVDRIARRVVELLGDKTVRDVAWEVIPDMAEVIIRDRLRELEGQVE